MEVTKSEITILRMPTKITKIRVVFSDFVWFKFPVINSFNIIDEVKSVVSAEDITAERSAAIKSPYA